jgi:hypothetical protein
LASDERGESVESYGHCGGVLGRKPDDHLLPRRVLGRPFDDFDTAAALLFPLPITRLMAHTLEPGPGLFEIVERQSEWLAEVISGHLLEPGRDEMWDAINGGGERGSRRQFATTGQHTILCNRHAYLRLLARDLNRRGPRTPGRRARPLAVSAAH